jgi:pimeloyl-ACP methyl ester carboxylesterase
MPSSDFEGCNMKRIVRCAAWLAAGLVILAAAGLIVLRIAAAMRETDTADAAAPTNGNFVATAMGRMFVQTDGPATGHPVILVHGSGAWGGLWRETSAMLAAHGYRPIAIDLPPFGFSDRPASGDYRRSVQARRILALVDAMHLEQPAIVGHSFGGGPVLEAAMLAPARFGKVVLVDPALAIDAPLLPMPLYLRSQAMRSTLVSAMITNPLLTRRMLQMLIHRKGRALPNYITVLQRPLKREGTTRAIAAWLPFLVQTDPLALSTHSANYHNIKLPLSVIWGDSDTVTPLDQLHQLHELMPSAGVALLPDVGHIPQIEAPELFQTALLSALSRPCARAHTARTLPRPSGTG